MSSGEWAVQWLPASMAVDGFQTAWMARTSADAAHSFDVDRRVPYVRGRGAWNAQLRAGAEEPFAVRLGAAHLVAADIGLEQALEACSREKQCCGAPGCRGVYPERDTTAGKPFEHLQDAGDRPDGRCDRGQLSKIAVEVLRRDGSPEKMRQYRGCWADVPRSNHIVHRNSGSAQGAERSHICGRDGFHRVDESAVQIEDYRPQPRAVRGHALSPLDVYFLHAPPGTVVWVKGSTRADIQRLTGDVASLLW